MRKIERDMIKAIEAGRNWSSANTRVEIVRDLVGVMADVMLHGHHIATVDLTAYASNGIKAGFGMGPFKSMGEFVTVNKSTLRAWPTPTTKSRLRALGVNVYTKNYETYLNGVML